MSMGQSHTEHPVREAVRVMGEALDKVAHVEPAFMTTVDKAASLTELSVVADRLAGLGLRVLVAAGDVAEETGARSAAAWLAHQTRTDVGPHLAAARLAEALDGRWRRVRDGLADGRVNLAQARVIVRALDELPADLDPDTVGRAEGYLVEQAGVFDPKRLRVLGAKVLEVVAPEVAEEAQRRALEDAERHARRHTSLTMRRRGDGTTDIRIRVADAVASRLTTYLDALASPRRGHLETGEQRLDPDTGRPIPTSVLHGRAFCTLLESIPAERLPQHGGSATTVVVTITHHQLTTMLGAAGLDTGDLISTAEAMRLACQAHLVPAVLDGAGQPLYLGRARRLFTRAQRLALILRDQHCRAEGCDIPGTWTEAHHKTPWLAHGPTDLDNGVLLCPHHHHLAHDPTYTTEYLPNGDVRYRRRT